MELLIRSLPITEKEKNGAAGNKDNVSQEQRQKDILISVKQKLDSYLSKHKSLQGFILDIPQNLNVQGKNSFYKIVSAQVATFGAAMRLPSRRTLVLLPDGFDCALVAHRICKNIDTSAMLFFEAGNSDTIINLIKKY
ncbi:MAG: hypothetical protein Ta2B_08890 [Termitinemataceae bacterium]|nr:MAG: hypothetical protein Ta2B_08890 [Termitinemataceae bacterium]